MSLIIIVKLIPYNESFKFSFLEDDVIKFEHPVSNYFLKLNDLSINLIVSLKWILWGYKFFKDISDRLVELDEIELSKLIEKAIQPSFPTSISYPHVIIVDNEIIDDDYKFENMIKVFYDESFFNENTKIHIKLKLNLNEYLLISNTLFPTLIKF